MNNTIQKQAWWKPAIVLFIRMSFWIAGPIVIALFITARFDLTYDLSPLGFVGIMMCSFIFSIIAIVRITKRYIQKIEKEAREQKNNLPQTNDHTTNQ